MSYYKIIIGAIVLSWSTFINDCWAAETLEERFLRESPLGWARIRDWESQVVGTMRVRSSSTPQTSGTEQRRDRLHEFKINGDLLLFSMMTEGSEGQTVISAGPSYAFKIGRRLKSTPFHLQSLEFNPASEAAKEIRKDSYFWNVLASPRACFGVPMDDLIKTPGFVIKGASETTDERGPVVRIEFESPSEKLKLKFTNAWITLRPSEDWAIQKGEYSIKQDWRIIHENTYSPDDQGRPRIYKSSDVYLHPPHKNQDFYDYTFEGLKHRAVPESEFTLSAFGLPEPNQPVASNYRSTAHYWFIGGGVALIALAFAIRWQARVVA